MTIRVLQVIGKMDRGGAESMIMNLYRSIDRAKIQFDFLVHSNEKGAYDDEIISLGGKIHRIEKFNGFNYFSYKKACDTFFTNHKEYRVVHGHIGSCAAIYLKSAKKRGCFTIAHSHSANVSQSLHDIIFKMFSYPTRYVADYFFGCSEKAGVVRFGKKCVHGNRYSTLHNAIDLSLYSYDELVRNEVRKELDINEDEIVLGTVGRLTAAKNPDYIVGVFSEALKADKKVRCIWVGSGELENHIKELVKNIGHPERIILTGSRSDVARLLMGFDCFIFPSLWEGLPVSVVEAQQSGLPCLASDRITKEVAVTDLLFFMSVDVSHKEWAKKAIELAGNNHDTRKSQTETIREAGYDINNTSKMLELFYTEKDSKHRI